MLQYIDNIIAPYASRERSWNWDCHTITMALSFIMISEDICVHVCAHKISDVAKLRQCQGCTRLSRQRNGKKDYF